MIRLLLVLLVSFPGGAWSQSSWPPCPNDRPMASWNQCTGTINTPMGGRFVGVFKNGVRSGPGIEYRADGRVLASGNWDNWRLVEEFRIPESTFPLPSAAPASNLTEQLVVNTPTHLASLDSSCIVPQVRSAGDGAVTVSFLLEPDGQVAEFRLEAQAGSNSVLDRAMQSAVRSCRGKPGVSNSRPSALAGRLEYVKSGNRIAVRTSMLPACQTGAEWSSHNFCRIGATFSASIRYSGDVVIRGFANDVGPKLFSGFGSYSMENSKESYTGQLRQGLPHGFGTITFSSGDKYRGEFLEGKMHGRGRFEWLTGAVYEGEFRRGEREGQGTQTSQTGSQYSGDFKQGQFSGKGSWKHPNGESFSGDFQEGLPHGQGRYAWPNGAVYTGEFAKGKRSGSGKQIYANGETYEGQFKEGKQHGKGVYTWPDGTTYSGNFIEDRQQGSGTLKRSNGETFVGEFRNDEPHGKGRWTHPTGASYEGEFVEGKRQGQGVYIWPNRERFSGRFAFDAFDGKGAVYGADGRLIQSGEWKAGQLVRAEVDNRDPRQTANREQSIATTAAPTVTIDASRQDRENLLAQIEHERKRREETEKKLAEAEARERQRLASQAQERDRLAAEARDKQRREAAAPRVFANRKALVIGNDKYTDVAQLINAVADAQAMTQALRSTGFTVFEHLNLDEKRFRAALRDFRQRIEPGDEVVFFFAGHGVQVANANYLLPIDIKGESEEQVRDEAVLLQRVLDDVQDRRAKFALAVIDACRDNPFKGVGRSLGGRGLAPTTAATGQMIMFSAGSGQQALDRLGKDDKERNGVFTRVLVREMSKPGVSVDRVLRNVRNEVVRLARSIGHEQTPALYDQAVGDFYFKPEN